MWRRALVSVGLLVSVVACGKKEEAVPNTVPVVSASPTTATPASATASAPATASASAAASGGSEPTGTAPDLKKFPGTEAGAKAMLAELVKPNADHVGISRQLRPTSADYKALFDAPTAAKIERVYSKEWDEGNLVIRPKPGQTEVKLFSAKTSDFKTMTGPSKDFPGGWKLVGPHLVGDHTFYRFKTLEPGKDAGMSFDGLVFVNGHWAIVPKPYRGIDEH